MKKDSFDRLSEAKERQSYQWLNEPGGLPENENRAKRSSDMERVFQKRPLKPPVKMCLLLLAHLPWRLPAICRSRFQA